MRYSTPPEHVAECVDATESQAAVIAALWDGRGRILTYDQLSDACEFWTRCAPHSDRRLVQKHVSRARALLAKSGLPLRIETRQRFGYRMIQCGPVPWENRPRVLETPPQPVSGQDPARPGAPG